MSQNALDFAAVENLRKHRPKTPQQLKTYLKAFLGIEFSDKALVPGMTPPFQVIWEGFNGLHDRLLHVSARGSGKTMEMATLMLLNSFFNPGCMTAHIAPIGTQANFAYKHLKTFINGRQGGPIGDFSSYCVKTLKKYTEFTNDSTVTIHTATDDGVRGGHVQRLFLDEVDNLDSEIFETCVGMLKSSADMDAQVLAMSTWNTGLGLVSEFKESWNPKDIFFSTVWETAKICTHDCKLCQQITTKDRLYTLWESCHGPQDDDCPYGRAHANHPKGGAGGHVAFSEIVSKMTLVSYERWLSEFESQSPRSAGKLFTWFVMNNEQNNSTLRYESSEPLMVGLDYGSSTDPTVFIFAQNYGGNWYILDAFEVRNKDSHNAVKDATSYSMKKFGKLPDIVYRDPSARNIHWSIDELWPSCDISYPRHEMKTDKVYRLSEAVGIPGVNGQLFIDKTPNLDELRKEMASIMLVGKQVKVINRSPDYVDALSYLMAGRSQDMA